MERERREESQERGEKRVRTDTDTDVESTQSRQKKGQMKSIFVKQHEELYDKTNDSFKDNQKKKRLWEQLAATRNLPIKTVKKWFETQRTRYGKLRRSQDKQLRRAQTTDLAEGQFQFSTRSHQKEGSFQAFKSSQRPSAAAASVPDTSRDTESEMEISIASDVTHQPSSTSPKLRQPPVATTTTSADPVLDHF